jgi:superfamily II DNA or RNA helicase
MDEIYERTIMDTVTVEYVDDVHIRVRSDAGIAQEISDYFTFFVPGYQFMPKYKSRMWDGKIRLFNPYNALLYAGLLPRLEKFCRDRDYRLVKEERFRDTELDLEHAVEWIRKLNPTFPPRDYQVDAFVHAIRKRRALLLSPTASGKSFIIYLLVRYFNVPTLIVVPTTSLVNQMYGDFEEYGFDSERYVHKIYSGHDKLTDKPIVVTTWQSVYQLPKKWFDRYKLVIGDEAHGFKAKSLTSIMSKLTSCPYKIGLTGTLDGTETNKLVLEGLFGSVYQVTTTSALMESGAVAQLDIQCLVLHHPEHVRQQFHKAKATYDNEMKFIIKNEARNKFIKNLVLSLEGNSLVMFRFVEDHGEVLVKMIRDATDRPVYFVAGKTNADDREEIRKILEKEKNAIAVCSEGTFSTGVNVKNLHNVIFASPSKARIKVLQSIGRGLRISETKKSMTLYDIADDISYKSKENHTLKHFVERVKIYVSEKFKYQIHKIRLSS